MAVPVINVSGALAVLLNEADAVLRRTVRTSEVSRLACRYPARRQLARGFRSTRLSKGSTTVALLQLRVEWASGDSGCRVVRLFAKTHHQCYVSRGVAALKFEERPSAKPKTRKPPRHFIPSKFARCFCWGSPIIPTPLFRKLQL